MSKDEPPYMTPALKALCNEKERWQRKWRRYSVKNIELQKKHNLMTSEKEGKPTVVNSRNLSNPSVYKKPIYYARCVHWTVFRILPLCEPILIPKDQHDLIWVFAKHQHLMFTMFSELFNLLGDLQRDLTRSFLRFFKETHSY